MVVWDNTELQCGKKWAWPAARGILPPRSKNPRYAPAYLLSLWCPFQHTYTPIPTLCLCVVSLPAHLYTHTHPLSVCGVPPSIPIYPYLPPVCVWCPSQHTYIPIPTPCLCVVSLPAYLYTHTYPLSVCGVPPSTPIYPYLPSVCVWCPSQHTNNIIPIPTLCLCVVSLPAHLYTHTYPLSVCGVLTVNDQPVV